MWSGIDGKARRGAFLSVGVAAVGAAAIVLGYAYLHAPRATRVRVGDMAPDFTLPSIVRGDPVVHLSDRRGGPTLLVFFDSRTEGNDPYFLSLQRLHAKYFPYGLTVIGVAMDPNAHVLPTFADRNRVTFPIVTDPFAAVVHKSYGTPREPEAYLLDRDGRVDSVYTTRVDWQTIDFQKRVEKYIRLPGR
jgi:peroxiredoxin